VTWQPLSERRDAPSSAGDIHLSPSGWPLRTAALGTPSCAPTCNLWPVPYFNGKYYFICNRNETLILWEFWLLIVNTNFWWNGYLLLESILTSNKDNIMERLYQGHLHPKLEVPILTCPGRNRTRSSTVGGKYSSKELFEQYNIAIRNIYIWARDNIIIQTKFARNICIDIYRYLSNNACFYLICWF
jgi:hypothetical protein